ncbi:hypothetical protein D3C85_149170 [compost metagenome]
MANNKTLRRQAAAAAAAEQAPNMATVEEVTGDALDTSTTSEVPGSDVVDQAAGLVEGDQPVEEPAPGSEAPEGITEQPEGLVGDESDGPAPVDVVDASNFDLASILNGTVEVQRATDPELRGYSEPITPAADAVVSEAVRGETPVITALDEVPFLPPAGDEPATLGEGEVLDVAKADEGNGEPVGELPPAEGSDEVKPLEESVEDEQAALNAEPQVDPANSDPLFVEPVVETPAPEVVEPVLEEPAGEVDYTTYSDGRLRAVLLPMVGKDPSEAWSREDMLLYLVKGVYPSKTVRNNWIYDARRSDRVKTWSTSVLLDFIEERLQLDPHLDMSAIWDEAFARYKVPTTWTVEAFREYVCNGSVPEYTAKGVLINDRQREQKQVHHLTFRELRAALLGEIKTQFTHEQLLSQYRKRLGITESYSEERLLAEMPNQPDEVSMDNSILRAKLDEYKQAITKNPGTQSEETAGACQTMLYKAIRDVTKRPYGEFVEGWNIILDFVNENYSALFDPYKARRGWSQVALGKSQLQLFEDLLTVVIATREPGNRAAKLSHNLEIVLRHLPNENERQNFFMYYQVG